MPFEVTPSKQVIIDRSNVGPEDALRIVTDDVVLYCMIDPEDEHKRLRLVPEAIPKAVRKVAEKAARELISSFNSYSAKNFEEWYINQPDMEFGLLTAVADKLASTATVRGSARDSDSLNIGSKLVVYFNEREVVPRGMNVSIRDQQTWTANGVITRISPARRFDAIVWNALHN